MLEHVIQAGRLLQASHPSPVLRSACRLNTWPSDGHSAGPQVSGRYGHAIHTQGNTSLRCLLIVETWNETVTCLVYHNVRCFGKVIFPATVALSCEHPLPVVTLSKTLQPQSLRVHCACVSSNTFIFIILMIKWRYQRLLLSLSLPVQQLQGVKHPSLFTRMNEKMNEWRRAEEGTEQPLRE